MSAALESILEVLKQEAEVQVRTEYENEIQRLRGLVNEYQQELERVLSDRDEALYDLDAVATRHDKLIVALRKALDEA